MKHDCSEKCAKLNDGVDHGYGEALHSDMWFGDGKWQAGNGEYVSFIRYCPFCGTDLFAIKNPSNPFQRTWQSIVICLDDLRYRWQLAQVISLMVEDLKKAIDCTEDGNEA